MNFLQNLETLLGSHQLTQPQSHQVPTKAPAQLQNQPMAYMTPKAPVPLAGHQVSPQSQAIYEKALQTYQTLQNQHGHFTHSQAMGVGQSNQLTNQQFPIINQGGAYNPGYMPLQRTGYGGPGATYGLQPADLNYKPYAPIQQGFSPQQGIGLY